GCVVAPVEPYDVGAPVAYPAYGSTVVTPGYYSAPAPYYYGAPSVSLGVWGWSDGHRRWRDPPPPPRPDWGRPPPPRPHYWGRPDGPRPDVRPPPRPPQGQWQRPTPPPRPRAPLINPEGIGG
ncbi:MAG TPA: hypothetical protein PKE22_03790, partial [Ottowia sp.]|nr:hypothetical protein [Ottowia sp.]